MDKMIFGCVDAYFCDINLTDFFSNPVHVSEILDIVDCFSPSVYSE